MATFKLNIGRIRGCPEPSKVLEAMEEYGLPDTEEYGVLDCSATEEAVFGTIVRKTQQTVQRLDPEAKEVTATPVEKATAYPFGLAPQRETLEIYSGSASAIEQVGIFFSSCLAFPTVTDPIELDICSAIGKLSELTQRFQLKSIRVSDYAHNSFMAGPYAPKFLDSEHGKDFMEQYADYITTANVRFAGQAGRINAGIKPQAAFSYSCKEEDQPFAMSMLRQLI